LESGREPADVLSADIIVRPMNELVDMCDIVELYGLVDFEMVVREEQILRSFTEGLDLLAQ
jgi:hypothetical protein